MTGNMAALIIGFYLLDLSWQQSLGAFLVLISVSDMSFSINSVVKK